MIEKNDLEKEKLMEYGKGKRYVYSWMENEYGEIDFDDYGGYIFDRFSLEGWKRKWEMNKNMVLIDNVLDKRKKTCHMYKMTYEDFFVNGTHGEEISISKRE